MSCSEDDPPKDSRFHSTTVQDINIQILKYLNMERELWNGYCTEDYEANGKYFLSYRESLDIHNIASLY